MKSIKEYFETHYYDSIYDQVIEYVDNHISTIKQKTNKLRQFGEYEVCDVSISQINIYDSPGMDIQCDVLVSTTVVVQDGDIHYDNEQEINLTYTLTYKGAIDVGIFVFSSIKPFWDSCGTSKLSQDLVPYIKSEDLDKYAELILAKYYPEVLKDNGFVDPTILASRLGLKIIEGEITQSSTVFGRIYFREAEVPYHDWDTGNHKDCTVKAGTIFVDPTVFFWRNIGAYNNTVIHECVHWILHRKAFELQILLGNNDINKIECVVDGTTRGVNWDALSIMEWQANAIAPKIQMPREAFCKKADELFSRHSDSNICDAIESIIVELSECYRVSKLAAKIRLVELGYDEAIGAFNYVDGHYVRAHAFKKGTLEVNQTFTIPAQDAAIERKINPDLRRLTETGDYLFVENHYVYNTPLYVQYNDYGRLELTDYARSHMDECCLIFDMKITSEYDKHYHTMCYLNRKDSNVTFEIKYHNGYQNSKLEKQIAMRQEQKEKEMAIYKQMTNDPEQCLKLLLKWRNMTYTSLGAEIDRAPKTISRIAKGEETTLGTVVLICFALRLPPLISKKLIEVLGFKLNPNKLEHQWIDEALNVKYPESVDGAREYLAPFGVKLE